jgi:hypothetical protein
MCRTEQFHTIVILSRSQYPEMKLLPSKPHKTPENLLDGLPPVGDRFCQKIAWFMWPPPLNLSAGPRLMIVLTQSVTI